MATPTTPPPGPAFAVVYRDSYGAICTTPEWVSDLLRDVEAAGAWKTGIESDRKHRGTAINTALYSYDESRTLALIQVRQCIFRPGHFNRVRKDYYLAGHNENGSAFAHPVDIRASGRVVGADPAAGVRLALSRIWGCDEQDLDDIVRHGDVAFVPVGLLPEGAEEVAENAVTVRESHHVQGLAGGRIYRLGEVYYVAGRAKIEHAKGQHPTARVKGGVWRVVAGVRARVWGFTRPTAD